MGDDKSYLDTTRGYGIPLDEPLSDGDPVALESFRDVFWSLLLKDSRLEEFVCILERIRDSKPNYGDNIGTEDRVAFYHKIRIESIEDIFSLKKLFKLQLPRRKSDHKEIPRLIDETSKIVPTTQEELREKLDVLLTMVHQCHSNLFESIEALFDACLKLEPRDSELEQKIMNLCICFGRTDDVRLGNIFKTLMLRHFTAARETNQLRLLPRFAARDLNGFISPSEVLAVGEEIFRVKQEVTNYFNSNSVGDPPVKERFKYLAWEAMEQARLYFSMGFSEDAEKICRQAIVWYGVEADDLTDKIAQFGLRIHLSQYLIAQGKNEEAINHLIESIKFGEPLTEDDYGDEDVYRPWSAARILLAKAYRIEGDLESAETLLFKAIDEPDWYAPDLPGTEDAIRELISIFSSSEESEKLKKVIEIEQKIAKRKPEEERVMLRNSIPGYFINNYPYFDERKEGRRYLELLRSFPCSLHEKVIYLSEFAEECLNFDRYDLCLEAVTEALRQFDELGPFEKDTALYADVLNLRARLYIAAENFAEAERDLADVLRIRTQNEIGHKFATGDLASLYLAQKKFDLAESGLLATCKELSYTPSSFIHTSNLLFDLAFIKFRKGDLKGAQDTLERAAKLLYANRAIHQDEGLRYKVISLLALIFDTNGDTEEAKHYVHQALSSGGIAPTRNLAWILMNAGVLSERKGHTKRAWRYFSEAQSVLSELGLKKGMLPELVQVCVNRVGE